MLISLLFPDVDPQHGHRYDRRKASGEYDTCGTTSESLLRCAATVDYLPRGSNAAVCPEGYFLRWRRTTETVRGLGGFAGMGGSAHSVLWWSYLLAYGSECTQRNVPMEQMVEVVWI